jgi:filamentous hemagglutinin family protein
MQFTRTRISALLLLTFASSHPVYCNPVGERVVAGSATFQRSANTLTVQQGTDRAIINWQGFSIGASELTRFVQPSAASAVLNRVVSGDPSSLLGRLEANGKVFLINPNGILVGGGAVINTNSFIASTLDVSNAKFLAGGDLSFVGDSRSGILNLGNINARGGDVFLIAHTVENAGTITASNGSVGLAAGTDVVLKHAGDERLFVHSRVADQPASGAGVTNSGVVNAVQAELRAAGGHVYALAVNNSGTIQATGIIEKGGRILLASTGGNIENSGRLVARNANGDGGNIQITAGAGASANSSGIIEASGVEAGTRGGTVHITGEKVALTGDALVDVSGGAGGGIALLGGDYQGGNPAVANAQFATVDKGVRIYADAGVSGDGGKVIVWADQDTVFNGQISARGGATGGDGGLIETSGKSTLTVGQGARADAGATAGKSGRWLLDPTDFTVSDGPGDLDASGPPYTPTAGANTISGADISVALQSGTDVEINTNSAFGGQGNVTFTSNSFNALVAPGTSKATLRVIANNDITIGAALGGTSANNQFVVDFKAGRNITVSKATAFSSGFIGARNVTLTGDFITINAAVQAVGEIVGGTATGKDGNLTLTGTQGISTTNLSGSANTLVAKGLLTLNSSSGGADLQGKTEARELTGKVNANFIQSRGNANVSTSSTAIGTLRDITSEGGRVDIDNFGSLAVNGAISAAGANQNVAIRTIGDMNFLPGASITTSATGTTTLTTLANPFAGTPPAGNIASTTVGSQLTPVVKGGGALVLKPLGSAGISTANPLFTAVSQLEAAPVNGSVFVSNDNSGGSLTIGTNAAGRNPDTTIQGVVGNSAATTTISIVNNGSIEMPSSGERVEAGGPVSLRALGANSDIVVLNEVANGVASGKSSVTLEAGRDINVGRFVPTRIAGNIIGATGVDLTAGNRVRIIGGSSVFAQGSSNINALGAIVDIQDLGAPTLIQTQGGAINLATRAGGRLFLQAASGGGLFTNNTAGRLGNINITADRMVLEGVINAGAANVDLSPQTGSRSISIAPNSALGPDTGKLVIPDAALDRVVAGTLTIGRNSGDGSSSLSVDEAISRPTNATYSSLTLLNRGNVNVASPIDVGTGALSLQSGIGNVQGAGNITAKSIDVSAGVGSINLGGQRPRFAAT